MNMNEREKSLRHTAKNSHFIISHLSNRIFIAHPKNTTSHLFFSQHLIYKGTHTAKCMKISYGSRNLCYLALFFMYEIFAMRYIALLAVYWRISMEFVSNLLTIFCFTRSFELLNCLFLRKIC